MVIFPNIFKGKMGTMCKKRKYSFYYTILPMDILLMYPQNYQCRVINAPALVCRQAMAKLEALKFTTQLQMV